MSEPDDRRAIIAARNKVLALVLVGFVVLFFAITIVKRGQSSAEATSVALVGSNR